MPGIQELKALRQITWQLAFVFAVSSISTFAYGFDNQVYSTIQAMDPFQKRFGRLDEKTGKYGFSALHLAYLNSLGLPLKALGVVLAGVTADHLGRKWSFMLMQVVCVVGIAVSYTATTFGQILAGRIIVQCFVGWETLLMPLYNAEVSPSNIRGAMVALFVFAHQFGAFLCSFVTFSTSKQHDDNSWKIPIAVGFAFPCSMFLVGWFIPESPRWLVRKGKHEKALKSLTWLMGSMEGFDAQKEVALLEISIEEDHATKGRWVELIQGTNRIRSSIAIMAGVFNQLTGQSFTTQYGTLFVKSFHTINPFTFNVISRFGQALGPVISLSLVDVWGRRPLYLVFGVLCCAVLLTQGGLGTGSTSTGKVNGIIAMTTLFGFAYSAGFGAIGAIISAEVPHLRLRDKTSVVVYVVHTVGEFLVSFTLPYLLNAPYADLGSRVGFIYGSIAFCGIIWGYFYLPETKGRSLEELEHLWRAEVAPRKFKDWKDPHPLEEEIAHGGNPGSVRSESIKVDEKV